MKLSFEDFDFSDAKITSREAFNLIYVDVIVKGRTVRFTTTTFSPTLNELLSENPPRFIRNVSVDGVSFKWQEIKHLIDEIGKLEQKVLEMAESFVAPTKPNFLDMFKG